MCESLLLIKSFVARLLDNNRSAQLTKPPDVELLGNSVAKEG